MMRSLGRLFRAHPKTLLLVLIFLGAAGTGVGYYSHIRSQEFAARQHAEEQLVAARKALRDGSARDALHKLDECLAVWPDDVEVLLLVARAYRLAGDFPKADAHLKKCIKLQKGASEAVQLEYLLMRAQTGEEEEVKSQLYNLISQKPKHPGTPLVLETLAGVYMRDLRYGPAYECLSRWIKEEPNRARPYHWRGWVAERLNDNPKAMQDYAKALELDPDLVPVRLRIAEIHLAQHSPGHALPHLLRLRRQHPDRADILARLGECRFLQGRAPEARQLLEKAAAQLPRDMPVFQTLAKLELEQGRPKAAEKWSRRALKADPAYTEAWHTLATSLQRQGRRSEADQARAEYRINRDALQQSTLLLKEEAQHPTDSPTTPWKIGVLLLRVGQDRQGEYWLKQALMRDANHRPSHQALAELYAKKGDREKAAHHRRFLAKKAK
jgi:predicted Zn-dependent protease